MKRKKQIWISEEAYRSIKVNSALEGLKLTAYIDKKVCDDTIKEPIRKKGGYYGFLK